MKKVAFAEAKTELDEACSILRSFTLGLNKVSQKAGEKGIAQVIAQCERLEKLFSTGPDAKEMANLVVAARFRVKAAESRLELLRKK